MSWEDEDDLYYTLDLDTGEAAMRTTDEIVFLARVKEPAWFAAESARLQDDSLAAMAVLSPSYLEAPEPDLSLMSGSRGMAIESSPFRFAQTAVMRSPEHLEAAAKLIRQQDGEAMACCASEDAIEFFDTVHTLEQTTLAQHQPAATQYFNEVFEHAVTRWAKARMVRDSITDTKKLNACKQEFLKVRLGDERYEAGFTLRPRKASPQADPNALYYVIQHDTGELKRCTMFEICQQARNLCVNRDTFNRERDLAATVRLDGRQPVFAFWQAEVLTASHFLEPSNPSFSKRSFDERTKGLSFAYTPREFLTLAAVAGEDAFKKAAAFVQQVTPEKDITQDMAHVTHLLQGQGNGEEQFNFLAARARTQHSWKRREELLEQAAAAEADSVMEDLRDMLAQKFGEKQATRMLKEAEERQRQDPAVEKEKRMARIHSL